MKKVLVISMVMLFAVAMVASAAVQNWSAYITIYGGDSQDGVVIGQWAGATDALTDQQIDPLGMALDEPQAAASGLAGIPAVLSSQGSHVDIRANDVATKSWTIDVSGVTGAKTVTVNFGYSYNDDIAGWGTDYNVNNYLPGAITFKTNGTTTLNTAAVTAANRSFTFGIAGPGSFTIAESSVPEPGSMLALGSGLVGLVGFAIRRRK